ncbi:MAG TPA: transcriptional regulator [Planctomycetes bacterium]|nr:transcriptional regulator [Planctomycetota bacterium]
MTNAQKKLYRLKAEVIAAVGHPLRLAIIDFLRDGEQCVCDIAAHIEAKRSNVSRHLGVLLKAHVVSQRKDGLKVMYKLRTPCVLNFARCVEGVLRESAREAQAVLDGL